MDDLDGDNPDFKKSLILKKNQKSMEGRQTQVRWLIGGLIPQGQTDWRILIRS